MSVQVSAGDEAAELVASLALGPTAQALFIPELLSLVLSFSNPACLATSARVCKGWCDPALNHLWRDLHSAFPLLELLFDINLIKDQHDSLFFKKLAHILVDADWDRFHSYGNRVRSLEFDETITYRGDPDTPDLDSNIVAVLCLHHPFGAVFLPYLQELSWTTRGSALSVLPFLSGELRELHLEMSTQTVSTASDLFKAIRHRTPRLVNFHLETEVQGVSVDTPLARWLRTTENLEEISLPPYYLTPALIQTLGSLPKLTIIRQSTKFTHAKNSSKAPQYLPTGTFPNLDSISFNATLSEARRFLLASQEVVSRLSSIGLHACGRLDTENILNFTQHIAQNCPMMTEIGLNLFTDLRSREQSLSPLSMALLESLYPCAGLEALSIGHPLPFTFQEDDVMQIGRAWPQMSFFDVGPDPDFSLPVAGHMGNSFSILSVFAKALPKLELLSIYFNKWEPLPFTGNLYLQTQFQQLTEVRFGLSPAPGGQSRQVGFYIASLCKERPAIGYGKTGWHIGALPNDWAQAETAWKEVDDAVGFAMEVKLAGLRSL